VRTADADAAKARAEAEAAALRAKAESHAAALKAQVQADATAMRSQAMQTQEASRAKAVDADAIKARAEADAAALRQKAESEAAELRRQAESEAAAVKAKAQVDAAAVQSQAASAAKSVAAPPQPMGDDSRYDGAWVATYECSAVRTAAPFTRSAGIVVRAGEFKVERGVPGKPGYDIASGRPAADGTLLMTGNGISPLPFAYGRRYDIRFEGRWTGDRFVLHGAFGARTCEVEITRPGTASEARGISRN
jgi:hypothetical protein